MIWRGKCLYTKDSKEISIHNYKNSKSNRSIKEKKGNEKDYMNFLGLGGRKWILPLWLKKMWKPPSQMFNSFMNYPIAI